MQITKIHSCSFIFLCIVDINKLEGYNEVDKLNEENQPKNNQKDIRLKISKINS